MPPGRRSAGMDGAMSREWGAFVAASKVSQVKDVWDVKGAGSEGGPKASRKQLEEMTARFRAASEPPAEGDGKKDYVSFEQLCQGEEDFDSGMAQRVAQRKVGPHCCLQKIYIPGTLGCTVTLVLSCESSTPNSPSTLPHTG